MLMIAYMMEIRFFMGETIKFLIASIVGCIVIYFLTLVVQKNLVVFKYLSTVKEKTKNVMDR